MDEHVLSRRDTLKLTAVAATALALPYTATLGAGQASQIAASKLPKPYTLAFKTPKLAERVGFLGERPLYVLTQKPFRASVIPGFTTTLWGYNDQFPGPTFRVDRHQKIAVRQINALPATHPVLGYVPYTSTHLHGAASLPQYDGYANDITYPGQWKDYLYDNEREARTIWYHDHAVHHTTENVYMGLAGQYHIIDPAENGLGLPRGKYEVPITISDAAFASNGELLFDDRGHSGVMGDVILVNGVPWPLMQVEPRKYRFRVLDASIARAYRLHLSTGGAMTVIATDGGLVREPQQITELRMSMGERYDLVIDFAPYAGKRVELRNRRVNNTIDFDHTDKVMAFQVGTTVTDSRYNTVPPILNPNPPAMDLDPAMATRTRKLRLERQHGEWVISGRTWAEVVESGFQKVVANPAPGDLEIWEFENSSGGWFHPMHLHMVDFKILDRNGRPPLPQERGPKDVVYLGENEKIRVITQFEPHDGRYMLHCHNNSHEDHDMMVQFRVGQDRADNDPITAAPPQDGPPPPV